MGIMIWWPHYTEMCQTTRVEISLEEIKLLKGCDMDANFVNAIQECRGRDPDTSGHAFIRMNPGAVVALAPAQGHPMDAEPPQAKPSHQELHKAEPPQPNRAEPQLFRGST